jgi:hypothetical protein
MVLPGIGLFLKVLSFIFASWFLVHLLAILGVFLAFAYPLWWLLMPENTPCFICRVKKEGEQCPFCRKKVQKSEGFSPKSFSSVIFNAFLILALSFVSLGLVFVESRVLFKLGFPPTQKTVSFIIPPKGQYRLGEIFPMKIEIAGIKTPINAIQADLSFDPQKLQVVDISTNDSFANIFIQKEINNEVGYARLTGGLPNPGFASDHGLFGTIFFQGKDPGVVEIEFLPSSMVLANDGRGTNVLKELAAVPYLILPERISEEEEELQTSLIKPLVLGEETEETQLKFYEEGRVLGEELPTGVEKKQSFNLGRIFLDFLEEVDRFILSFWSNLVGLRA